jgi:hypothetical protein
VNSVKACTGMTDPEKEVGELRKQRDELVVALGHAQAYLKTYHSDYDGFPLIRAAMDCAAIKNAGGGQ